MAGRPPGSYPDAVACRRDRSESAAGAPGPSFGARLSPRPRAVRAIVVACFLLTRMPVWAGPELQLDVSELARTARLETAFFPAPDRVPERVPFDRHVAAPGMDGTPPSAPDAKESCALDPDEACVGGPGLRLLLRFDVLVHNRGDADLYLGDPATRPDLFTLSPCHGHYHFTRAATYELLDETGRVVGTGHKQGFCMEDTLRSDPDSTQLRKYNCNNQGISVGMADLYASHLDCQWIDVTDVRPGRYRLHVSWDPDHLLPDGTHGDNEGFVPVTIPPDSSAPPVVESIHSPAPGAVAEPGTRFEVSWTARADGGVASQEVWLSRDDGATWSRLVGDVLPDRSTWGWDVPLDAVTETARLKVVARDARSRAGELLSPRFAVRRQPGRWMRARP